MILCIETSTDVCSVALARAGECISEINITDKRQHSGALIPSIEKCLAQVGFGIGDIEAVAVGSGPGSYTGLRIGASTAKGICYTSGVPLIEISSLEGLITPHIKKTYGSGYQYIMPTIDARRMEVYTAIFDIEGNILRETHNLILDAKSVEKLGQEFPKLLVCGNGAQKMTDLVKDSELFQVEPSATLAQNLCALAHGRFIDKDFSNVATFTPNYYKEPNITVSKKRAF